MATIKLNPEPQDYVIKIWTLGRRVIVKTETPAQARAIKRQIQELMTDDGKISIGFTSQSLE